MICINCVTPIPLKNLIRKYRYSNVEAIEFLDSVFSPLISYENQLNPEIVRTISNGEFIYRARDVKDEKQAEKITAI